VRRHSGHLLCGQVQDCLDGHPTGDVDEFFHSHPGLFDQVDHRQQELAVVIQGFCQPAFIRLPNGGDGVIISFHSGSPQKGLSTPILTNRG
jgi:hypothetical protein